LKNVNWDDKETFHVLRKVFSKIWKVNYANLTHMAYILYNLHPFYRPLSVFVVDSVLEELRRGLEVASFDLNQKRVSLMKYLSELYRYKLVETEVMYETLYLTLSYGHPKGRPAPGVKSNIDPPNEFFRIRLVCTIFESSTVTQMLEAQDPMKLDLFLLFFQYYAFLKDQLPMETNFQFQNTFKAARPNWRLATNGREASIQLQRMIDISQGKAPVEPVYSDDTMNKPELLQLQESEEQRIAREQSEMKKKEEERRIRKQKEDERAAIDFEREFQKLMLSRVDRKTDRQVEVFDAPVPHSARPPSETTKENALSPSYIPDSSESRVMYTLMTRKNARPSTHRVSIPSDTQFVVSVSEEQQRENDKRERIKDFVLSYDYDKSDNQRIQKVIQPDVKSTRYSRLKLNNNKALQQQAGGDSSIDAFLNDQ
jgi:regulator of nonsense transcripts 2